MPRLRCNNGSRRNKSGTCVRKMNGPKKSRCSKGTQRVYYGPKKGTCKANRAVYSKGPQRFRGSVQRWTPTPKPISPMLRRSSRLAAKWTRNGHMRYGK